MARIRSSAFITHTDRVRGFVFDGVTGKLDKVVAQRDTCRGTVGLRGHCRRVVAPHRRAAYVLRSQDDRLSG
ncbi:MULTISPECIES: hypothetical protein [unclassified Streptomyces]|uniref:hypothetical protein n=1 Tax=unclassified Streptomyces TaxID=2593676 RepID=UPI00194069A2